LGAGAVGGDDQGDSISRCVITDAWVMLEVNAQRNAEGQPGSDTPPHLAA